MSSLGGICCKDEQARLKKLHFFKKWPKIKEPDEPDNIKWENLGVRKTSRSIRVCISWLIAIFLILLALAGIVIAKNKAKLLKEEYNTDDIICPSEIEEATLKALAYSDMQIEEEWDR